MLYDIKHSSKLKKKIIFHKKSKEWYFCKNKEEGVKRKKLLQILAERLI